MKPRKCKCKICKAALTTDIAYKVTTKGVNSYYCSEEEYKRDLVKKEEYKMLMKYIAVDILDYDENQIIPPILIKKVNELRKLYEDEVVKSCFETRKDDIKYWLSVKDFQNEFGMVSYVMAIINSSINDVYKEWKNQKSLEDIRDRNNVDTNVITVDFKQKTRKGNDISEFLGEDDD